MTEPKTLLVAIMFVTILTLGIANILASLAEVVTDGAKIKRKSCHISWILLLLLVHFDLFWQTAGILGTKEWTFGTFLYVIGGPIVLFFATSLLLKDAAIADDEERALGNVVSRGFLLLLAIVQLWVIGGDVLFGGGLPLGAGFNAAIVVLVVVLILSQKPRVHAVGVAIAWCAYLILLTLLGLGIIS
jgi:hypothetical protein